MITVMDNYDEETKLNIIIGVTILLKINYIYVFV